MTDDAGAAASSDPGRVAPVDLEGLPARARAALESKNKEAAERCIGPESGDPGA